MRHEGVRTKPLTASHRPPAMAQVGDFRVSGNRFAVTGLWVLPKAVFFAFAPLNATITAKVPEKPFAFHPTITGSCLASGGKARRDSSRLCSRMSAIAARKFARHSSSVFPCPFAPGTSAQYATNQGPSCSTIAVNSLRMTVFYLNAGRDLQERLAFSTIATEWRRHSLNTTRQTTTSTARANSNGCIASTGR